MAYLSERSKPVTVPWIKSQKGVSRIAMLTAYDYPTAYLLEKAGVEILLVGDSLGTVVYGEDDTLSVELSEIIRHTRAVVKGSNDGGGKSMVLSDLPFLSYQASIEQAVLSSGRCLKEARADGVKMEGGKELAPKVQAVVQSGIPVCAHIGLMPQNINLEGSYRMHGKTDVERQYLIESAKALEDAGAFLIVLECVEKNLAEEITKRISIPTIGIGSGLQTDGQVLVTHDLIGMTLGKVPRFVEPLADLKADVLRAAKSYVERTKESERPGLHPINRKSNSESGSNNALGS